MLIRMLKLIILKLTDKFLVIPGALIFVFTDMQNVVRGHLLQTNRVFSYSLAQ